MREDAIENEQRQLAMLRQWLLWGQAESAVDENPGLPAAIDAGIDRTRSAGSVTNTSTGALLVYSGGAVPLFTAPRATHTVLA